MSARDLASMWLRDRAEGLRAAANRAEKAYSSGEIAAACKYVAASYRKAAVVLDDAATDIECSTPMEGPA